MIGFCNTQPGVSLDTWQIGTVPSRLFRIVGIVIHTNFFDNDNNWRTIYVGKFVTSWSLERDAFTIEAILLLNSGRWNRMCGD
jgi:hypothetical protein